MEAKTELLRVDGTAGVLRVPAGVDAGVVQIPSDMTDLDLELGDNASVQCVSILEGGIKKFSSCVGAGANLQWFILSIGEGAYELKNDVVGKNGTSSVSWAMMASDGKKQKCSVRNIFSARNGGGEVAMRGVAETKGRIACDGKIEIGLGGGGTQTYLTQNVLLLDSVSGADAVPGLEIKTNDVKASHSATVSRINPEDLFYAASRGIPAEAARRMLIEGFLGGLFDNLSTPALREELVGRILEATAR